MRRAALNDVAAQVAAQRAVLQEQALREVEAQRATLQAQALSDVEAQRAAAQQALAADIAAGRSQTPTVVASAAVISSSTVAVRTVSSEKLSEITKKSAECERKRGEDRSECLSEIARLRARYGL
jgi:hypothetical protein